MAKIIGYIRVSTELQDTEKQRHLLLEYAQQNKIVIDDFIEVEISSRKSQKERRIDELQTVLQPDDTLIAAELSRLGRNMLEVMNLINTLQEKRITVILIRQPELSTNAPHVKLLTAIYGYIDETEREFISMRTRQGLAAAKAKGKLLGRPKGSRNKNNKLMPFRDAILTYLNMGLDVATVRKIINSESELGLTYQSYRYFILQDSELTEAWKQKHLVSESCFRTVVGYAKNPTLCVTLTEGRNRINSMLTYSCAICDFQTPDPAAMQAHSIEKHPLTVPVLILRDGRLTDPETLLTDHLERLIGPTNATSKP